jgi:hypothetical protein
MDLAFDDLSVQTCIFLRVLSILPLCYGCPRITFYCLGKREPDEVHRQAGPAGTQLHAGDSQARGG